MSAKESGVYPTIDTTGILPSVGIRGGTIGLIGHADLNATGEASYTEFTTSVTGSIITLTSSSFPSWVATNIDLATSTWSDGEAGTPTGSYDPINNAMKALELIFLGNGNAVVKLCILDSGGSPTAESTTDLGLTEALVELLKHDDVSWIHCAGKVPIASVQSHVATASSNTYAAERIYVAGLDFFHVYSTAMALSIPSAYTNLQTDNGRTIVFCTKAEYYYQNDDSSTTLRYIGGNELSAYYLGLLTGLYDYEPILRKNFPFKQVDITTSNSEFIMPVSDREDFVDAYINYVRRQNSIDFFEIGRTFCGSGSAYTRITTRRIMDITVKTVRANLFPYLGKPINNVIITSADAKCGVILSRLANTGYLGSTYDTSVYTTTQDAIDGIIHVNLTVSPSSYIGFIYATVSAV